MDEKVYRVLEFDRIRSVLQEEARSPMAGKAAGEIVPSDKKYEIEEWLQETDEAVSVILAKGSIPLGGLYDVKRKVRYAEKGRVLSMGDLLEIASSLRVAEAVRLFLKDGGLPEIPKLKEYAGLLTVEKRLADRIGQCIESEDHMADTASPKLHDIRRKMLKLQESARARINAIISSPSARELLQDAVVTMREGHLVIPVKQEHRGRFPGVIYDRSSTGATLFIEPQAVVEMHNEIRELELKEREEVQRILAELSAEVAAEVRPIINNQKYLTRLDLIFAKARLSVKYGGCSAELNTDGILDIRQGRHPLIDPEKVVPLDITAGKDYKTLIITGPNTGGKTVALKTAGLLMLMTQAGMHIPAGPGTVIPVMKNVCADIGDEQSIEQSLSTFSSHMKNIVDIARVAGPDTFILLDELGAGTDPAEGAALAISILEFLSGTGALIFATTHYSELKKYALTTEGVENASMEFDVETLSPTYRLRIGMPGKSNAFEISRKLGIESSIIDRASEILGRKGMEFENLISVIEDEKKSSEEELRRIRDMRDELEQERREFERRKTASEEKSRRALEKAREEAREILIETRQFADEVKQELKELSKAGNAGSASAGQR
ncbi:MAG: endonuclease MutS2, partial [Firmicutes bacterium]|nr:endonuclease MutS2 [Bacillota bacterium]